MAYKTLHNRFKKSGIKSPLKKGQNRLPDPGISEHATNPAGTHTLDVKCAIGVTQEELLAKHNIDTTRLKVVSWHVQHDEAARSGGVVALQRVKLVLKEREQPPEAPFQLPDAKPKGWTPPRIRRAKKASQGPRLTVISGDPHAPLHETTLCEHLCAYVEEHEAQIDQLGFLGDASDNSPFGRHRQTPAFSFSVSETWQAGYDHLASVRARAPEAKAWFSIGNHDHWPMQRARELGKGLAEMTLPGDKYPILDPRTYLRLDELGIECPGHPGAEYHASEIEVLPDLTAMHGTKAGTIGGAVKELAGWEGTAIIQGHDHKLGMFLVVRRLQGGRFAEHWAISAGTLARKDLGYDPKKNCAQGFLVIAVHPNGAWAPTFARYDHDREVTTCGEWICG